MARQKGASAARQESPGRRQQQQNDQRPVVLSSSREHDRLTVYIPDALKRWAKIQAFSEGRTLSDIVEEALSEYRIRHTPAK